MIVSKFRFFVLLPVAITTVMLVAPIILVFSDKEQFNDSGSTGFMVFFLSFYLFVLIIMIMSEFRTKAIIVSLNSDSVQVKSFLGLGKSKSFSYTSLEGYRTSAVPSRGGTYEYLYLIYRGKK